MGFLRRGEPIHEKLAREGGLDLPRGVNEVAGPPTIDPTVTELTQPLSLKTYTRQRPFESLSPATVSAAASALRKAGARRVEVVTFARAVR